MSVAFFRHPLQIHVKGVDMICLDVRTLQVCLRQSPQLLRTFRARVPRTKLGATLRLVVPGVR